MDLIKSVKYPVAESTKSVLEHLAQSDFALADKRLLLTDNNEDKYGNGFGRSRIQRRAGKIQNRK